MAVAIAIAGILFQTLLPSTYARDLGQWENIDSAVREGYRNLKQPHFPQYSCCGEADAYWCDEIHVKHGNTYCTITDDRNDAPLRRAHVPTGSEIYIPPHQIEVGRGQSDRTLDRLHCR